MIKSSSSFHGSDLEKIEKRYSIKKEEITSFSANVNPLGISPLLKKTLINRIDSITTYPERNYLSLRKCIAQYINCDYNNIIVGNGTTEILSLFIQLQHPKKAMIIGPTYSEYEREISLGGGSTLYYPLKESLDFKIDVDHFINTLNESIDLLVLCNPNNPTSSAICQSDMRKILDVCKQHDIYVLIDETYVEFSSDIKKITAIPLTEYYNNLFIVRGVSKFFAAPGLRLGYAITGNYDIISEFYGRQNPWTINTLAEIGGRVMFKDEDYILKTRELINSERDRIYDIIKKSGLYKPYKPEANFILLKILDDSITSSDIFEKAIHEKMMIRDCSTFPILDDRYIRFCIMMPEDNDRLLSCFLSAIK